MKLKSNSRALGLRGQIIGGIVLLAVAATGIMGILSLKVIEQKVLYSKVREATALADNFRLARGLKGIKDLAEQSKKSGRLKDFEIVDKTGSLIYRSSKTPLLISGGSLILKETGLMLRHYGQTTLNPLMGGFNVNVTLSGGGEVRFTLSLSGLRDELKSIRRFIFYFSLLACVVIIGFGVYVLSITVVMPIRRLERTAKKIAGGDFAVRADEGKQAGYDEIGSLAKSFNLMAASVEEKILSIERVNRDLVSAQERLIMTEKLATAGRFAAGIAHEIGNPLGAVQGYLEILRAGDVDKDEVDDILCRMDKEIARINSIVSDFLDISRPSASSASSADVNAVLDDTLAIMKVHKGFEGVDIRVNKEGALPEALIDPSKLKQVFMNLLLNSADATNGAGQIKVETSIREAVAYGLVSGRRSTDIAQTSANGEQTGARVVVVSFTDNGPGISAQEKKKIFDPFFTTKEPGKGTGLGLFISEGIVEAYRGKIFVDSEVGEGTTFDVVLEAGGAYDAGE
ncbi:MAG: HAMP domain-containing protein [Proteobacteria bacterium]|nr:HAMP domain-containing protein [Pseudomonadota bacterium]